jgi:hypothetical protein
MNDASSVSSTESRSNLQDDIESAAKFDLSLLQVLAQSFALDELSSDIVRAFECTDLKNSKDVWVIEPRCRPCLLFEAAYTLLIVRHIGKQNFQRDLTIEFCILGKVNFAHTARADLGYYAIVQEICIRQKLVHRLRTCRRHRQVL